MGDPTVPTHPHATSWAERVAASAIPSVLGAAAFAVSFSNVRDVALANGTGEWRSWMLAASVELLAIGAALEVRKRHRARQPVWWAVLVLLVGVVATVAANLAHAQARGWGTVVAVWPALAYLLAASLKATRPALSALSAALPESAETVPDTADTEPEKPAELSAAPVVDELLPVARDVLTTAAVDGWRIPRTGLAEALRKAGYRVGNERALALYDACQAVVTVEAAA